jgi:hypothetical protein
MKMVRGMKDAEADTFVTDCPLSALRITHETGKPCMHPIEAVALALGLEEEREGVPEGAHASSEKTEAEKRNEEDRP